MKDLAALIRSLDTATLDHSVSSDSQGVEYITTEITISASDQDPLATVHQLREILALVPGDAVLTARESGDSFGFDLAWTVAL